MLKGKIYFHPLSYCSAWLLRCLINDVWKQYITQTIIMLVSQAIFIHVAFMLLAIYWQYGNFSRIMFSVSKLVNRNHFHHKQTVGLLSQQPNWIFRLLIVHRYVYLALLRNVTRVTDNWTNQTTFTKICFNQSNYEQNHSIIMVKAKDWLCISIQRAINCNNSNSTID